MHLYRVIF